MRFFSQRSLMDDLSDAESSKSEALDAVLAVLDVYTHVWSDMQVVTGCCEDIPMSRASVLYVWCAWTR